MKTKIDLSFHTLSVVISILSIVFSTGVWYSKVNAKENSYITKDQMYQRDMKLENLDKEQKRLYDDVLEMKIDIKKILFQIGKIN